MAVRGNIQNNVLLEGMRLPIWAIVLLALILAGCPNSSKQRTPELTETKPGQLEQEAASSEKPEKNENDTLAKEANRAAEPAELENHASEVDSVNEGDVETEGVPAAESADDAWIDEGTWTTRRLVALSPQGPAILDLSVGIDSSSLEDASNAVVERIAKQLFEDLEKPVSWEDLVAHPLVKSGWLGNLVPEEDQVDQIIAMYDDVSDKEVSLAELKPFLSRGLSRSNPLQVSDIGTAPNADVSGSPWGKADLNGDYSLDREELKLLTKAMEQVDFNGDSVVTELELNQAREMQAAGTTMNRMGSMLDTTSLLVPDSQNDKDLVNQAASRFAVKLRDHYTIAVGVPREQWSGWSQDRWEALDANSDDSLERMELQKALQIEPDAHLVLNLAGMSGKDESDLPQHRLVSRATPSNSIEWSETRQGGRLAAAGMIASVRLIDSYTVDAKSLLRQRLQAALKQPQLQEIFASQLQLQEGAFELLDPDENEELDDEEFEKVWTWLSSRQGSRMIVRWMLADRPWFLLIDQDGDQRITEYEVGQAEKSLMDLDVNEDDIITPNELPLLIRIELDRTDDRLQLNQIFGMTNEPETDPSDEDWFSAMDANRDGFLSAEEFFGDAVEFAGFDVDQDGFLSRRELYDLEIAN